MGATQFVSQSMTQAEGYFRMFCEVMDIVSVYSQKYFCYLLLTVSSMLLWFTVDNMVKDRWLDEVEDDSIWRGISSVAIYSGGSVFTSFLFFFVEYLGVREWYDSVYFHLSALVSGSSAIFMYFKYRKHIPSWAMFILVAAMIPISYILFRLLHRWTTNAATAYEHEEEDEGE